MVKMYRCVDLPRPRRATGTRRGTAEISEHDDLGEAPPVQREEAGTSLRAGVRDRRPRGSSRTARGARTTRTAEDGSACGRAPCTGEARAAERGRDQREQDDRPLLREPVDEPVGRVVATALVDRPALEQAHDRHERRVEDRHRQDQHGQQQQRRRRPSDLVARQQTEAGDGELLSSWLPESPMNASAGPRTRRLKRGSRHTRTRARARARAP